MTELHESGPAQRLRVLVVDDDAAVRATLCEFLRLHGYEVEGASSIEHARSAFKGRLHDLVVLDYHLPDGESLSLLSEMKQTAPETQVIFITAQCALGPAVEAMHRGAYYFLEKPFEHEELAALVERAVEPYRLRREIRALLDRDTVGGGPVFVGRSPAVHTLKTSIFDYAHSRTSTVLITGESGVGKDVAARLLHACSPRSGAPFLNITCSALPEALLESELFGHERGAFTDAKLRKKGLLEQADGGSIFLDEIGEMSLATQAKLLRFLEERAFRRLGGTQEIRPDVRVIAATHRDLPTELRKGRFRSDLYYRLAVLQIPIPPLRERVQDIEPLARFFIDRFNRELGKQVRELGPEALALLQAHHWPGNARELRNTIERAVVLTRGEVLGPASIHLAIAEQPAANPTSFRLPAGGLDLAGLERDLVVQALERTQGNQTRAARLLGITRDQMRHRIEKFNLVNADVPLEEAGIFPHSG